jgi:hypothetical protein
VGVLSIESRGSFPSERKQFTAQEYGHAHAVAQAIEWLSSEMLPWAIERDHVLQGQGVEPSRGFDRPERAEAELT